MSLDMETITDAKRHFDNEIFALRRDARIIRKLNANELTVDKWNPIQDILQRTADLESPRTHVHRLVESQREETLWHNLNEVIRAKANLALMTPDPVVNDQLDRSISKLEQVFDHEFSEASDSTE